MSWTPPTFVTTTASMSSPYRNSIAMSPLPPRLWANTAKAERTMKLAARLSAPVVIELKPGDDILEAPDLLFKAADGAKVKVGLTTPEIIARIRETTGDKLRGRSVVERFELVLTADGDVLVY